MPAAAAVRRLATSAAPKPPTAVVMLNMGGPSTVQDTGDYLSRLFHDGDLIPLPFQSYLAPLIARRRTPKIEQQYADIGGGSPILRWTREQGARMAPLLDELRPRSSPHKPYVAFRYARPLTEQLIDDLRNDGVQRAIAFSQYPQYSCSTTGSSLNELWRQIDGLEDGDPVKRIRWSVLDRWGTHPGFIDAVARNIEDTLATYDAAERDGVVLLFSAHSLPMSVVNRGDPYPAEVAATVAGVMRRLGHRNAYRLAWQSQVGPSAWLGQQTGDALKGLHSQGIHNVALVPIAFTSDHIETLFEMDREYVHDAREWGMRGVKRCASLNDSPFFVRALADLANAHLDQTERASVSPQLLLRCPGCTNAKCRKQKTWFASFGGLGPVVSQ